MNARRLLIVLAIAVGWHTQTLAGPHTMTYVEQVAPLGTELTFGGETFDLVRIPVRLYTGERYALIVPAQRFDPDFGSVALDAHHSSEPFVANITIDSFPARADVQEVVHYTMNGDFGTSAALEVGTNVGLTITIKLGTTLVSYFVPLGRYAVQTSTEVGTTYNFVPYAEWAKYRDPVDLVKAVNNLLDYIRVIPL
jgi:hypothetical protein